MISFKQFLVEKKIKSWKIDIVDVQKAVALLNANCKQGLRAISTNGLLFRGFKHEDAAMRIDSSVGERTSKDTNNLYQLMMDSSTALSDYPKRSKSLICSSNLEEAGSYGTPMVIIPFDGTEIIVSSRDDFVFNPIQNDLVGKTDIDFLTDHIEAVIRKTGHPFNISYREKNIPLINQLIEKDPEAFIKSWMRQFKKADENALRQLIAKNKNSAFTALSTAIFSPSTLRLSKIEFGDKLPNNVECWFSGKCIAIDARLFAGILHALNQGNSVKVSKQVLRTFEDFFGTDMELTDDALDYIESNL